MKITMKNVRFKCVFAVDFVPVDGSPYLASRSNARRGERASHFALTISHWLARHQLRIRSEIISAVFSFQGLKFTLLPFQRKTKTERAEGETASEGKGQIEWVGERERETTFK